MRSSNIYKVLTILMNGSKTWLFFSVFFALISGVEPIISLILSKKLLDTIINLIDTKEFHYQTVLIIITLQFLIIIFLSFLTKTQNFLTKKTENSLGLNIKSNIFSKVSNSPLSLIENHTYQNNLSRIQSSSGERFLAPLTEIFSLIKNLITTISIGAYLLSLHWIFLLIILINTTAALIVNIKFGYKRFELFRFHSITQRDIGYTSRLILEPQFAKEIKMLNLHKYLIDRWSRKYEENSKDSLKLFSNFQIATFMADILKGICYAINLILAINITLKKNYKISDFVVITQAIVQMQNSVNSITTNISNIFENGLYLKEYFSFIEEKHILADDTSLMKFPNSIKKGITVNHLTFNYNQNSQPVLNDITLNVNVGEKIAIVGENGSGKSTLVKCLLGIYPISQGEILIDDVPINNFSQDELNNNISILFQDFIKYPYTVSENIGFGQISQIKNSELIKEVAKRTGADLFIDNLKMKYDTYLTQILYEGEDLSGGEWQKLALSRSIMRNSQILILDEPTSAMDPRSESDFYKNFREICNDKTTIFISHKLISLDFADRIIVMKSGNIIESGSLSELLEKNGEFKKLYSLQASQITQNYFSLV